ncbi:MAG: hypothetical protein KH828_08725 [Clostridiales bacterium]|nr:hypothetical protein [Clostridiales bacterium]
MALSKKDLQAIADLFEQKFDKKFKPAFDAAFDEKFKPAFDAAFDEKFDQKFDEKFDQRFDEKFTPIDNRLSSIENTVEEIKQTVTKNYGMLEEFYVYQKEKNTETSDTLDSLRYHKRV